VETLSYAVRVLTFSMAGFCVGVLGMVAVPFVRFIVKVDKKERVYPRVMGVIGILGVAMVFVTELLKGYSRLRLALLVPEDWILFGAYGMVTAATSVLIDIVRRMIYDKDNDVV
jgi:H+/Cl- antiporter ClcA